MCHKTNMSVANFFKRMVKIQSPRIQCCLCAFSVFAALLGMFMMSAGICLILNYNFMEVDTSGLPPHLHNDEGKKVVGIILLCVGLGSLGLSALVSTLYFTACLEPSSPQTTVRPEEGRGAPGSRGSDRGMQNGGHSARVSRSSDGHDGYYHHANGGHHHGNGATPGRASPSMSGSASSSRRTSSSGSLRRAAMTSGAKRPGALPALEHGGPAYSQRMNISTPPSARAHQPQKARHSKKMRHVHQGRFQTPLTSHPEEEEQSLNESRRSMSGKRRPFSPERGGRINYGADLNDDSVLSSDHTGTSDGSAVITAGGAAGAAPPVIITVDTSHVRQVSPYQTHELQDSSNDGSYNEGCYKEGSYSDSLENGLSKDTTQSSDHSNYNAESGDRTDHADGTHVYMVSPYEGRLKDLDDFDGESRDFDDRNKDFDEGNNDLEDVSRDFDEGSKDFQEGTRDFDERTRGFEEGATGFDSEARGFHEKAKGVVSGKNEEEESGRGSRSTDSLGESEAGAEGFEEAKRRLDDRMQQLIQ